MSSHQTSRSLSIAVSWPVRRATSTFLILGQAPSDSASSTAGLSAAGAPRRLPPSAVTTSVASASWIRPRRASAENPPKMTVWAAPIRVHASIAIGSSGIIGM